MKTDTVTRPLFCNILETRKRRADSFLGCLGVFASVNRSIGVLLYAITFKHKKPETS